jgi:murein DD-endopeptidase MepM/ murein hydrolase activator NlpD
MFNKKLTVKIGKKLTVFAVVAAVCVSAYPYRSVNADQTISDLQSENEESEAKKQEAQSVVDKLSTEKDNIVEAISELDSKVAEYQQRIEDLTAQKEVIQDSIADAQADLEVAKSDEEAQYEAMKLRIQYAYENDDETYVDTLFSSTDMSEIVNDAEYAEQVYNYDANMLSDLIDIRTSVAEKEEALQADLQNIEDIESEVNEDMDAVQVMLDGKETQLSNYANSIEDYQELVAQYQAEIDERDAKIAAIEAEIREKEAAAVAAGETVTINYTGGSFQWPVSTGGTVTSTFGARWGTTHQGLDIACPVGTPILAGESGTVIASYLSSSAGEYIVIDHGGGVCTEYMHNSQRLVQVGDTVTRGQVIAYSGNTGFSTGPHCHFGVRINGTRVDPQPYL